MLSSHHGLSRHDQPITFQAVADIMTSFHFPLSSEIKPSVNSKWGKIAHNTRPYIQIPADSVSKPVSSRSLLARMPGKTMDWGFRDVGKSWGPEKLVRHFKANQLKQFSALICIQVIPRDRLRDPQRHQRLLFTFIKVAFKGLFIHWSSVDTLSWSGSWSGAYPRSTGHQTGIHPGQDDSLA